MLETIKSKILEKHKANENIGLFFSLFDENEVLLTSNGVIQTDKPVEQLIELLYHGIIEKYPLCKKIIAQIPQNITLQQDATRLLSLSPKEYGLCLVSSQDQKSGVILPGTPGIEDMQTALNLVQKKFGLTGNVQIYTFTTEKIDI